MLYNAKPWHMCVCMFKLRNVHINILFSLKYDVVINSHKNINIYKVNPTVGHVTAHSFSILPSLLMLTQLHFSGSFAVQRVSLNGVLGVWFTFMKLRLKDPFFPHL